MDSVAIIGSGFSGTTTAINLIRKSDKPLKIFLIDKNNFAKGIAYSTDDDIHLLNVPASKMSALSDNPNHFIDWLAIQKEKRLIDSFSLTDFMPRKLYGQYLSELLEEYQLIAKTKNIELIKLNDSAIDVDLNNDGITVSFDNQEKIITNKLVLALGNYPPANIPIENPSFYSSDKYFVDPWNKSKGIFGDLQTDDPVLLIGSGLTMVDIALGLYKRHHRGNIFVISPHGYVPEKHSQANVYPSFIDENNLPDKVLPVFKIIRNEISKAVNQGFNKHNVIDAIRPFTQKIWLNLSLTEKNKFMQHLRHRWGVLRHRMPEKAWNIFNLMLKSEQLKVYAGKIKSFTPEDGLITVNFKNRNDAKLDSFKVERIINCTGPQSNYNNMDNPLINNLRNKGIIKADLMNLGIDATSEGNIINQDGLISKNIFTLGPPLKGILWESTAVPELKVQADNLANLILKG